MIYINSKTKILKYHIISTILVCITGTLLHFLFEWTNENILIAAFSAVNESVWEHLKLVFFPMLLTSILGYFLIGKSLQRFFCSRLKGILASIIFIIIFFYTYTGIIGTNYAILDIGSFFIAVILGELLSYKNMTSSKKCNKNSSMIILIILTFLFIIFTYLTPHINLFRDPITNEYGFFNLR